MYLQILIWVAYTITCALGYQINLTKIVDLNIQQIILCVPDCVWFDVFMIQKPKFQVYSQLICVLAMPGTAFLHLCQIFPFKLMFLCIFILPKRKV